MIFKNKIKKILNKHGQLIIFFRKNNEQQINDKLENVYKGVLNDTELENSLKTTMYNKNYFENLAEIYNFNTFFLFEEMIIVIVQF